MAKTIAFFADGTWNGPGKDENGDGVPEDTNVLKMFCNLAGAVTVETARMKDEQEKVLVSIDGVPMQTAKYIHGVGDSENLLVKALGGVFGKGVIARIVRGYTYISRQFDPGDAICIVGFSRGAYTARALGGMIASVGLLDRRKLDLQDRRRAYGYGMGAWEEYRQGAKKSGGIFDEIHKVGATPVPAGCRIENVDIRAIGVWDTVGSLGIPVYDNDERVDVFRFADTTLNARVRNGFHAVSIDERREDFPPTRWTPAANVEECWFAGAHSDVGGGYAECGLSDIALQWMTQRMRSTGLRFGALPVYVPKPDVGIAAHEPWRDGVWKLRGTRIRSIPRDAAIDDSVSRRMAALGPAYHPESVAALLAERSERSRDVA